MAADGPALLAAAVRAACLAHAPRRTVQAVAAAVTGVLAHPKTAAAEQAPATGTPVRSHRAATQEKEAGTSPEELLRTLRAVRSAQRKRKKERRRAAKQEEKAQESAPQRDEENTLVPATPGQRGDQEKPASGVEQVTKGLPMAVEKEEQGKEAAAAAAAEQREGDKERAAAGVCEGGRSSQDDDYHNQYDEHEQPPLKQVRMQENKEMDGIQSERTPSRSSRHDSIGTISTQTRQFIEDYPSMERTIISMDRTKKRMQLQTRAMETIANQQASTTPGRRRSRSKGKKKEK